MQIKEQLTIETDARLALLIAYGHAKKAALLAAFSVGVIVGIGISLFSLKL